MTDPSLGARVSTLCDHESPPIDLEAAIPIKGSPNANTKTKAKVITFFSSRLVKHELKEVLERLRVNQKLSNEVDGGHECASSLGSASQANLWASRHYCYYVYEYPIYGFQRVLEREMQKSSDVVAMGKFLCAGFVQIRVEGCGGNGMDSWTPFSPLGLGAFAETGGDMETDGGNVVRKK
nr:DnaJ domain protein [Ipomoea trifida]